MRKLSGVQDDTQTQLLGRNCGCCHRADEGRLTQEEPVCVENSPERRGEIGCSIVKNKPLPTSLREPVFWHIDRFDTGELAPSAVGPTSIAFEAHGAWWLLSVGPKSDNHHGGEHVAQVKLSPLPSASSYSILVISAYIPSGMTSRVHFHSGVEAFYVVDGEQCLQTAEQAFKMRKGETLAVPTGVTMRLVATGSKPQRAFAVIVLRLIQAASNTYADAEGIGTRLVLEVGICPAPCSPH